VRTVSGRRPSRSAPSGEAAPAGPRFRLIHAPIRVARGEPTWCGPPRSRLPKGHDHMASRVVAGIRIPDSALAREAEALVIETSPDFVVEHSRRAHVFSA